MTNAVAVYLVQLMPIFAGIAFVALIRLVAVKEDRIKIRSADPTQHTRMARDEEGIVTSPDGFRFPLSLSEISDSKYRQAAFAMQGLAESKTGFQVWKGNAGMFERMRDAVFERIAYDMLVVNGVMGHKKGMEDVRVMAWRKLGLADVSHILHARSMMQLHGGARLSLYVPDIKELLARILTFGGDSGFLLQYLAGYDLDIEAVENGN